jgi:exopolyphosphatase / guanosine-5'-triphosphate,3'-diphosphate pyrophosphatase
MSQVKYAAIDIGSNAVRLLLCTVTEEHGETHFKKGELLRIPLRLGEDVFSKGKIMADKANRFIKAMSAFKLLIDVYEPAAYRACATASLREASNGDLLVKQIRRDCGLKIDIIGGKEEAELIYANHVEDALDHSQSYLYIDVGGGSTELTLFDKGDCVASASFNIGTLRWLQGKVSMDSWEEMKRWTQETTNGHKPLTAIGSGGNINKIFKMLGRKDKPLAFASLKAMYDEMKLHTVEDRMEIWDLNPDRADVIVPAAKIYLGVMKAAQIAEIIVPQVGLVDGIVHQLHAARRQGIPA